MTRDLRYPDDANKVIDALHRGLEYDAALAVLGNACGRLPHEGEVPDLSAGFRIGGRAADEAVRRDAPALLARHSLCTMVSRFEVACQALLLQRRVLESPSCRGTNMTGPEMWSILKAVHRESRGGPVKMASGLVVATPSALLRGKMRWLEGIYKVRNCLMHRLGQVGMADVKPDGAALVVHCT